MQVGPAGVRDSMALFLQLEGAVASRGSLTPEQILDLRASAAHLNVSGEHLAPDLVPACFLPGDAESGRPH